MRALPFAIAGLALVGACSKPASAPATAASPEAASESAPPTLTAAQQKRLLSQLPAAYQGADLENGQAKFAICKSCHTVVKDGPAGIGPNLWGVFGRKAGTSAGFVYSDGMKALGVVWNADTIDHWIANPKAVVAGTKMTYIGMENAKDRTDVVAYLKTVTSSPPT